MTSNMIVFEKPMPAADYTSLISASTWAFIRQTEACYPADTASQSIAAQRAIYDAMACSFHRGYPKGITARDQTIATVPCRIYDGMQPTVIYLHGGGFSLGGLESHDNICAEICGRTGFQVVSVDYRLAPEKPHPAAFDDALAVTRSIAGLNPFIVMGDSAGGSLAASVAHEMRHQSPALGLVLIYAGLGGNPDQGSYLTHAHAPMLTRDDVRFFSAIRFAGGVVPTDDPTALALRDTDFAGLPRTIAFSAACDPIADDGRDYCACITAAGGQAQWHLEAGLVHGYLRARAIDPRAAASFDRIIAAVSAFGAAT